MTTRTSPPPFIPPPLTPRNRTQLGRLEANETNTVDELKALILERPDMEHVTSIKRIRLWDRLTTARSLRPPAPETTLKEMFIQDGREITMQVLDEEEELAPHSIILYLHKRNPLLRTWSEVCFRFVFVSERVCV